MTELNDHAIAASALVDSFLAEGIDHVTTVPDFVQISLHSALVQHDAVDVVLCANENQALTSAFGLTIGGKTPLVVMQNQGLLNCLNTLRSVSLDAGFPFVLCVGQFGREFSTLGGDPNASTRNCVNKVEPVLEALGISYWRLESETDLGNISEAFASARKRQRTSVLLVGTYTSWN